MAVSALQHGYRMTAVDDDTLVTLYSDSLANFGAEYAATQETMKNQVDSLIAMQTQLANFQQLCMAVGLQPLSSIYTPAQQQGMFNNRNKCNSGNQNSGRGVPQQPTMSFGNPGGGQQQTLCPPTPYKHWKNWNYSCTHSGDVDDTHTNAMCCKPGPTHNPNASCANIWADWLLECTRQSCPQRAAALPNHCPQQQQLPQQRPPITYYPPGGTAWQQPTLPMQFGGMPP